MRRRGRALVTAILGLALVGSAGVFGYRNMFGASNFPTPIMTASNEPNRIVAASSQPQAKDSGNASQVGAATPRSIEKLVSREEQPVTIEPPTLRRVGAPPRRPLPVWRYRIKRCRAKRSLPIRLGLLVPMPPRRSAFANRVQRTSRLRRTARIWLLIQSHLPMRTALRQ